MRLIIDIPNSLYANLQKITNGSSACKRIIECVKNGESIENSEQGDLISRKWIKANMFNGYMTPIQEPIGIITEEQIDNAPTVEQECYITGAQWNEFMKEHRRPQGELANEVWKLYEKHHSHLATYVIEFGDELKELLGRYGGIE